MLYMCVCLPVAGADVVYVCVCLPVAGADVVYMCMFACSQG